MTIIDGIGDEVTYFFITIIVVVIATIAWITTDIQQNLYVRTVYLLEHSRHETRVTHLTNHTESATISEGIALEQHSEEPEVEEIEVEEGGELDEDEEEEDERDGVDPVIEEIIATMDEGAPMEDANILRQRRLQRFQNPNPMCEAISTGDTENIQSSSTPFTNKPTEPLNQPETNITDDTTIPITIKLKFIDDNLKVVDAQLQELLGDFKRRHFNVELAANKLVRLIFNGQVLKHDQQTLASYGIFDNCVVHCLVHQPRAPAHGEAGTTTETSGIGGAAGGGSSSGGNRNQTHRDWDLGNLLIATLSFTLGSAWYFRFQYPQLFTIWTTIGLIGLTSGFGVIALVRYFPEVILRDQVIVVS